MRRDVAEETRKSIVWVIAGLVFFALIPLGFGAYHLIRSRPHRA